MGKRGYSESHVFPVHWRHHGLSWHVDTGRSCSQSWPVEWTARRWSLVVRSSIFLAGKQGFRNVSTICICCHVQPSVSRNSDSCARFNKIKKQTSQIGAYCTFGVLDWAVSMCLTPVRYRKYLFLSLSGLQWKVWVWHYDRAPNVIKCSLQRNNLLFSILWLFDFFKLVLGQPQKSDWADFEAVAKGLAIFVPRRVKPDIYPLSKKAKGLAGCRPHSSHNAPTLPLSYRCSKIKNYKTVIVSAL